MLRSYVKGKSENQQSPVKSDNKSQEPDKLQNAILKKILKFLRYGGKDSGEDDENSWPPMHFLDCKLNKVYFCDQ